MPENKQPGFMEPPGTPTFLGLSGEEVHAIWYGILDTFGRFHEGELKVDVSRECLSFYNIKRPYDVTESIIHL